MTIPQQFETVNPLNGLTEARLECLLLSGQQGDLPELQWLYYFVEKRNATVRAVKRKLCNALLKLDWNVKVYDDLDPEEKALAEEQRDELRAAYDRIGNLKEALTFLALADLRGFAHCNRIYAGALPEADPRYAANSWDVVELRCVEPWLWSYDPRGQRWHYNPEGRAGMRQGAPLANQERDWIIREVADPADEIFVRAHLDMLLALDDWAQHNDTLAVPPMFVIGPPNVSPAQEKDYQKLAEAVVSDGRGYLPNGSDVKLLADDGAHEAFLARLEFWRKEIVLTGTNGLLTMLTESGSGTLAGSAHTDTWVEVASGLAMLVSETMQEQFDAPILAEKFPGKPVLAYFEFAAVEEEDAAAHLANAKVAREAGYAISAEELSEKSGYTLAEAREHPTSNAQHPTSNGVVAAGVASEAAAGPVAADRTDGTDGTDRGNAVAAAEAPGQTEFTATEAASTQTAPAAGAQMDGTGKIPVPPVSRPSRAGEASPGIVEAAVASFAGIEEKWLGPVATVYDELEAALADPAVTLDALEALLEKARAGLPGLLPKMGVADLATALREAGAPGAIQGTLDALTV